MRRRNDLLERQDATECVGNVRHGNHAHPIIHQFQEVPHVYLPALVDRADYEFRSRLFADELPRHDVGVVLEMRDENLLAVFQAWPAPALCNEIDGGRRAAGKYHFRSRSRVDKGHQRITRAFVGLRCTMAQGMNAAVHVRMVVTLVLRHFIDDALRLLRRCRAVQISYRYTVDILGEGREVVARVLDAFAARRNLADLAAGCSNHSASPTSTCRRRSTRPSMWERAVCTGDFAMIPAANARVSTCAASSRLRPRERR